MLFSWVKLLAIPTAILTLLQPSTATPTPGTVAIRRGIEHGEIRNIHSNEPQEGHPSSRITLGRSIERRSNVPCPVIGCIYFQRYPNVVIIPTIMAVETLKAFWTRISIDAMQADIEHINNSRHFTIAAGAVQVTMSCVGQAIPWDFVQDFASQQIQAVAMGWLDTFDAVYQQDSTGYMVFVSLKIMGLLKDSPSRKRPRPSANWRSR